jgi:haloalkane dehalogenase
MDFGISTEDSSYRKYVSVLDTNMAYVDIGNGDPIVFLHGNPTPSYLWRNIIPRLLPLGRCLAPDYVGMGNSGAAANGCYRLRDHQRYLDAWFDAVGLRDNVIFVVHDWGSALGFSWAQRHADRVKALVHMEAIVRPFLSWDEWPDATRAFFQAQRTPVGEDLILQKNVSLNTYCRSAPFLRTRWRFIAGTSEFQALRGSRCSLGPESSRSRANRKTSLRLSIPIRDGY